MPCGSVQSCLNMILRFRNVGVDLRYTTLAARIDCIRFGPDLIAELDR